MRYALGIDPVAGLALWDCKLKRFEYIKTTDFWGCVDAINELRGRSFSFRVVIETPQENRPVWFGNKRSGGNPKKELAVAQAVGENKALCKQLIEYMKNNCVEYITQRPSGRSRTKVNAGDFHRLTGWDGRTSEHGRDAGMLVFGM